MVELMRESPGVVGSNPGRDTERWRRPMQRHSTCRECGMAFSFSSSNTPGIYCSQKCSAVYRGRLARRPIEERFWEKVNKDGPVSSFRPDLGPCWLWMGAHRKRGDGNLQLGLRSNGTRASVFSHIFAYTLLRGPVPEGLELDHLCRLPQCVNPDHLEPVTHRENVRRGLGGVLKTHCPSGHTYDTENTYYRTVNGYRICRACRRERDRRRGRISPPDWPPTLADEPAGRAGGG